MQQSSPLKPSSPMAPCSIAQPLQGYPLCAQEPEFQVEDSQHASARPDRNGSHPEGSALHESPTGGGGASLADVKAARAELEMGAHRVTCMHMKP